MSSELRAKARKINWKMGKSCLVLVYLLVFFLIGFIQGLLSDSGFLNLIITIAVYVIEIPISFGLMMALFKLFRNEEVLTLSFLDYGFSNFSKAWNVTLKIVLKMVVPLIFIVAAYILFGVAFSLYARAVFLSIYSSGSSGLGLATFLMFAGLVLLIVGAIWEQ